MEFHRLGIVGGDSMGRSIAHQAASNGIDVVVAEVAAGHVARAQGELAASLEYCDPL